FTTASGTTDVLTGLTLTGGNGAGTLASGSGGAIYNNGATLTLNQCTLANNTTSGSGGVGGGIRNGPGTAGSLTLNRCTVANNTANTTSANIGGVACVTIPATLNQCTFSGNSTVGIGGALGVGSGGSLAVTQSTIAGNHAGNVGGINNIGTTTITNSIVATNTAGTSADIANPGTLTFVGSNIVQSFTGTAPSGIAPINADPLLAPLGSYGGPTQTMALLLGSPARNAAVNFRTFTSDQRGFAITDNMPDIGAYEAGDISNYFAWIYENLPASTATDAAAHATTFDYDGDGVSNFNEWIEQTNPGDPTSYLHITQTTLSGTTLSITFPSVSGRNYSVEYSTNLVAWNTLEGPLPDTGSTITRSYLFAPPLPPKYFLRVRGGP
ncbi:MAG: hypothetical protein M3R59_10140, partial [Verrucomicrobiota bacterium]|nr:hypothetical protein [Verrucomicrobiota bacterium]